MSGEVVAWVGGALILLIVHAAIVCEVMSRRKWNNGRCGECGSRWEHYDTDSQGGKGFKCEGGHGFWW